MGVMSRRSGFGADADQQPWEHVSLTVESARAAELHAKVEKRCPTLPPLAGLAEVISSGPMVFSARREAELNHATETTGGGRQEESSSSGASKQQQQQERPIPTPMTARRHRNLTPLSSSQTVRGEGDEERGGGGAAYNNEGLVTPGKEREENTFSTENEKLRSALRFVVGELSSLNTSDRTRLTDPPVCGPALKELINWDHFDFSPQSSRAQGHSWEESKSFVVRNPLLAELFISGDPNTSRLPFEFPTREEEENIVLRRALSWVVEELPKAGWDDLDSLAVCRRVIRQTAVAAEQQQQPRGFSRGPGAVMASPQPHMKSFNSSACPSPRGGSSVWFFSPRPLTVALGCVEAGHRSPRRNTKGRGRPGSGAEGPWAAQQQQRGGGFSQPVQGEGEGESLRTRRVSDPGPTGSGRRPGGLPPPDFKTEEEAMLLARGCSRKRGGVISFSELEWSGKSGEGGGGDQQHWSQRSSMLGGPDRKLKLSPRVIGTGAGESSIASGKSLAQQQHSLSSAFSFLDKGGGGTVWRNAMLPGTKKGRGPESQLLDLHAGSVVMVPEGPDLLSARKPQQSPYDDPLVGRNSSTVSETPEERQRRRGSWSDSLSLWPWR